MLVENALVLVNISCMFLCNGIAMDYILLCMVPSSVPAWCIFETRLLYKQCNEQGSYSYSYVAL